jgi:hypothetical protein
VRGQGKDPLRPTVALIESALGQDLVEEDQQLLDLSDIECCGARAILRELTPDQARERFTAP